MKIKIVYTFQFWEILECGPIFHHDLVDRLGLSVSQMTTDMFRLS
jgi:hypothetical protein